MNQQEYIYHSNPVHRNRTPGKTQWKQSITSTDEETIFRVGIENGWRNSNNIFSLLISDEHIKYLDVENKLNYARFRGKREWHGWPANQRRSKKDIPDYDILLSWVTLKYTKRSRINKLRGRKVCSI